jgi:nitrogen fixation/metabolism regulation signal transduction histidine kinase
MFDFVAIAGVVVVAFLAGVVFSQKVKDWFAGVPAAVRAEVTALEAKLMKKAP